MMALAALGVLLASHSNLLAFVETYMYYSQSLYVLVGLLVLPAGRAVLTISSPRASAAGALKCAELVGDEGGPAPTACDGGVPHAGDSTARDGSSSASSSSSGSVLEQQVRRQGGRRVIPGVRAPRISIQEQQGAAPNGQIGRPPRWQAGGAAAMRGAAAQQHDAAGEPLPSPSLRGALQHQSAWGAAGSAPQAQGPFAAAAAAAAAAAEIEAGAVVVDGRELCGVRAAPCEATSSLGTDDLPADCGPAVAAAVSETHLLQFGAMLGESSCRDALARAEAAGPVGSSASSLYGSPDTDAFFGPWEPVVQEAAPGLLYWGWRRPLRCGLYMYMTRSVFLGVTPAELRGFMMDDASRLRWDRSMVALGPALRSSRGVCAPQRETDLLFAGVKFPKPMAQRSYTYARRVWARPCDGGCYVLARGCPPPAGMTPPRGVAVTDYSSGAVIRAPAAALLGGHLGSAAEVLMIYFEDSHVRAGFANLGIKKGLWPMLQRTDRALRCFLRTGDAVAGSSVPGSPRCSGGGGSGDAAGFGAACGGGKSASGGGRGWLQSVVTSLRALASAAGMLWGVHARMASLLPRMELRMLRWLVSHAGSAAGLTFGRGMRWSLPAPAQGGSTAAATARLHRVNSHPLTDCGALPPAAPRLQVRIVAPEPSASSSAVPPLARVGSHPLTLEDLRGLEIPESPEAPFSPGAQSSTAASAGGGSAAASRAARAAAAQRRLRRSCSCGAGGLPAPAELVGGEEWPAARLASAPPRCCSAGAALRGPYAASCPAGSCTTGSDLSGPAGSLGAYSCGSCAVLAQRRRAKGRIVVRLIQAAGVRVAHKLLSSLDQQPQQAR